MGFHVITTKSAYMIQYEIRLIFNDEHSKIE